jgi:hypothetical protein
LTPDKTEPAVTTGAPECSGGRIEEGHTCQDETENILDLVAASYRPLNEQEQRRADSFFKDEFGNCGHIRPTLRLVRNPGIASDAAVDFFLAAVRSFHVRFYPDTCSMQSRPVL